MFHPNFDFDDGVVPDSMALCLALCKPYLPYNSVLPPKHCLVLAKLVQHLVGSALLCHNEMAASNLWLSVCSINLHALATKQMCMQCVQATPLLNIWCLVVSATEHTHNARPKPHVFCMLVHTHLVCRYHANLVQLEPPPPAAHSFSSQAAAFAASSGGATALTMAGEGLSPLDMGGRGSVRIGGAAVPARATSAVQQVRRGRGWNASTANANSVAAGPRVREPVAVSKLYRPVDPSLGLWAHPPESYVQTEPAAGAAWQVCASKRPNFGLISN